MPVTPAAAERSLKYLVDINEAICNGIVRVNSVVNPYGIARVNSVVLTDPEFFISPGGITKHHDYRHGLVTHVAEVMRNVSKMTGDKPSPELVTAVIWHDYKKTKEYALEYDCTTPSGERVVKTDYHEKIRHVAGSAMEFYFYTHGSNDPLFVDRVVHLLLSHHGRREWGSPVEPKTAEAFLLHAADMMSAHGVNL